MEGCAEWRQCGGREGKRCRIFGWRNGKRTRRDLTTHVLRGGDREEGVKTR